VALAFIGKLIAKSAGVWLVGVGVDRLRGIASAVEFDRSGWAKR
jgi:hypothetical protein